jgi:hypothetical protein
MLYHDLISCHPSVVLNYAHGQQYGTSCYNNPQNTYDMKQEISTVQVSINKRDELNTPKDGADGSKFRL